MLMSKSRLEKFLYALYSLDHSDLPNPLSRIEEIYKCLVTGEEPPTFEPLSRVEKYLMAILGAYNADELPNPLSRVEVLLYKLATGDDNLDDVKTFLTKHEELLAEIIRNRGAGGNIDIEYVLYTLSTEFNTLYNTAEKPVKSAILKGNTLVNITKPIEFDITTTTTGLKHLIGYYDKYNIKPTTNKKYLVCCYIHENTIGEFCLNKTGYNDDRALSSKANITQTSGVFKYVANCNGDGKTLFSIGADKNAVAGRLHITCMVLEYQQGMENWDIPYFEGIQSVKMPVLTTMGENLIDSEIIAGWLNTSNGEINNLTSTTTCATKDLIKVKPATQYSVYKEYDKRVLYAQFNEKQEFINFGAYTHNRFTTDSNAVYVRLFFETPVNEELKVMLYEGGYNSNISYEPYKSNILTVNEEVVLRGFDSVEDTLNLNTGEYVKRIGELTLDGSEHWLSAINDDGTMRFNHSISDFKNYGDGSNGKNLINNKLPKVTFSTSGNRYGVSTWRNRVIFYTEHTNVNDFKQWLSQNPTTVQYELETPIVKTVDLSVVNQDGNDAKLSTFNDITHVTLSSEGLIPEAELEVVTRNEEVLNTMSLEMDDISATQTTLDETSNAQSENVDATMIATTEIYEGLL